MHSDGTRSIKVRERQVFLGEQPTWSLDAIESLHQSTETLQRARDRRGGKRMRNANAQTVLSGHRLGPSLHWLPDGRPVLRPRG